VSVQAGCPHLESRIVPEYDVEAVKVSAGRPLDDDLRYEIGAILHWHLINLATSATVELNV
jgi:hypothetical protein